MSRIDYHSNNFKPEIFSKIHESSTSKFSICTAYTSVSMINKMAGDDIFLDKLDSLLIGDPLSLGFEGGREEITTILEKNGQNRVYFANLGRYNVAKNSWKPIIHSKLYIGYNVRGDPIWAFVGSVNFSENGMNTHQESLVCIEDKRILIQIESHFQELKALCAINSDLNLERYTITKKVPPYYFQIVDNSNSLNNIHIIVILINKNQMEDAKRASEIRLDFFKENSKLFKLMKSGRECEFILIFSSERPLINSENIMIHYAKPVSSVNPQLTADHNSNYSGYVRYLNGRTPVFWDKDPPPPNVARHQRALRILSPSRATSIGNHKDKKVKMINAYLSSETGREVHELLKHTSDEKIQTKLENPNPDHSKELIVNLSEVKLSAIKSVSLIEKLDPEGMEKIDESIIKESKYSLKSDDPESFKRGYDLLGNEYTVESFVTPKYFIEDFTGL